MSELNEIRTHTPLTLVGLDAGGTPFDPRGFPGPTVFAFGSERSGLSAHVRANCDEIVSLPMKPEVSSLNLATSVSAVMYLRIYAGQERRNDASL
jgi:TrmH family RNA methyltransferase